MPATDDEPAATSPTNNKDGTKTKTNFMKKNDNEPKWWNEWPLPGPTNRPAVWITKVLSKSPLIIGWDDERMERRAMAALAKASGKQVSELTDEDFQILPTATDTNNVKAEFNHFTFGLMGIVSEEITKRLLNLEVDDEDAGLSRKRTLKDVGGRIFVDNAEEPNAIKDTELYKLALRNLQWQRDNYLVGKTYADQRKQQRKGGGMVTGDEPSSDSGSFRPIVPIEQRALDSGLSPYQIPFDATAYGNIQLTGLASWFIPSQTVHYSLLPIVVGLPLGPLFQPILQATANLIPLSQSNLDFLVKDQLLWFLDNSEWRQVIKSNTKGYIANTYVDRKQQAS
jgi:hypothetical protein